MTARALRFGSVAADYERFRPGYPDEVVTRVLDHADRPLSTALEIGAGTGKATRVFARHGVAVTATDPDAAMLAELRTHVPDTVSTVRAALEDLSPDPVHDLVYAAASLHWTRPEGRWDRVAGLLRPGGVFASFGGKLHLADPDVDRAVRAARSAVLPDDEIASPDATPAGSGMQWPGTELARSELFRDVRQSTIRRRVTVSAADWVGHLSTVSAYLELPAGVRHEVLGRVAEILPGDVAVVGDITVHLARLR